MSPGGARGLSRTERPSSRQAQPPRSATAGRGGSAGPRPELTTSGPQGQASLAAAGRGGHGHAQTHTDTHSTPWSQAEGRGSWGRVLGVPRPGPTGESDFPGRSWEVRGKPVGYGGAQTGRQAEGGLLKGQGSAGGLPVPPLHTGGIKGEQWPFSFLGHLAWHGACLRARD